MAGTIQKSQDRYLTSHEGNDAEVTGIDGLVATQDGGAIRVTSGVGGNGTSGTDNGGNGGNVTITSGAGGTSAGGTAGSGGDVSITCGITGGGSTATTDGSFTLSVGGVNVATAEKDGDTANDQPGFGYLAKVINVGHTLTAADSGSFLIPTTAAQTFTLPSAAAANTGVHFTFISGNASAHVITSGAANLDGSVLDNSNAGTIVRTDIGGSTSITLVNGVVGDTLTIVSNGTNWLVTGSLNDTPTLA